MLRKVIAWIGYAVFLTIVVEGAARLALGSDEFRGGIALDSDAAWRLHWVNNVRNEPEDVYARFDDHHPIRGWTPKAGLRDIEIRQHGRIWKLSTNSHGLRGKVEYAPRSDKLRIAVYGDSFTFGEEVDDNETYVHQLQKFLPRSEAMNFGVHGYGHDQIYLYMQETLREYDPDIVVLGYVRDDARRNMRQFRDFAKPKLVVDARSPDGLRLVGTPVPTSAEVLQHEVYRSKFLDILEILYNRYWDMTGGATAEMERVTLHILAAMRDLVEGQGRKFLVVYLPHSEDLMYPRMVRPGRQIYERFCERPPACIDLRDRLAQLRFDGEPIRAPGHWHEDGHRWVARLLAEHMTKKLPL